MTVIRRSLLRLRAVIGRQKLNDDMQVEMREHLDRATELLIARGMSPAAARLEARREFGNLTVIQNAQARDVAAADATIKRRGRPDWAVKRRCITGHAAGSDGGYYRGRMGPHDRRPTSKPSGRR